MKNKIITIIVILFLVVTAIVCLIIINNNKGLEKLIVFGNEIEIVKGKTVYEIELEKARIKKISNGCEIPIEVKYNGKTDYSGISYVVDGEKEAYFKMNFNNNIDNKDIVTTYDLYVHVYLNKPLKIECERE